MPPGRQHAAGWIPCLGAQGLPTFGQPRGTQRYLPAQAADEDAPTRAIVALAAEYGRYGYRRITTLLQESGWRVGFEKVRCLHDARHSGFTLCRCGCCGQHYLAQFHEIVDWARGAEDMWLRLELPTTEEVVRHDEQFPGAYYNSASWCELCSYMHLCRRPVLEHGGCFTGARLRGMWAI